MEGMRRARSSLAIIFTVGVLINLSCIAATEEMTRLVTPTPTPTVVEVQVIDSDKPIVPTPIATPRPIGTPVTIILGSEATPVTYYSKPERTERPDLMTYHEFLTAMALTSWRPYVIHDRAMQTLLWELAKCESGTVDGMVKTQEIGDTDIGYTSIGVFQINIDVWPKLARQYNLFIPDENMQAAFEIWQSPKGFDNWSCYPIVREYFN